MIGVAGTVSTLVSLALRSRPLRPRRSCTTRRWTGRRSTGWRAELAGEPAAARAGRKGIEAGRADVIAGGALVLCRDDGAPGHDALVYSESDILDGIAADLLARQR